MPPPGSQNTSTSSTARPLAIADGQRVNPRYNGYGDAFGLQLGNPQSSLAHEGSYFRACNAAPNTAIACAVIASYATTTALICIQNTSTTTSVYLDYIRLFMTVIPASSTTWDLACVVDTANRAATGGTVITGGNVNSGSGTSSSATITVGPTSIAAATATRLINRARIFNAVPVVNSTLFLGFNTDVGTPGQTMNGATAINLSVPMGPMVIGPGHTGLIHSWYASNASTGPSFEVEMAYWER